MRGKQPVHLARIKLALLQRRVRRGDRLGNDDTLVLLRSELGLGGDEQEIDAAQHRESEHNGDGKIIQAAMQPPLVGGAQANEAAVDIVSEPGLPAAMFRVGRLMVWSFMVWSLMVWGVVVRRIVVWGLVVRGLVVRCLLVRCILVGFELVRRRLELGP